MATHGHEPRTTLRQRLHALSAGAAGVAVLTCAVLTGGCSLWGQPHTDTAPPTQSSQGSAPVPAARPGTSLGRVSESAPPKAYQAPTPLNASSAQASEATQAQAALCADLRSQIRSAQASARQAPSTSISEDIVAARVGKADQRLDDLRTQYDQNGCSSSQEPATHERVPSLPAAPGAVPP